MYLIINNLNKDFIAFKEFNVQFFRVIILR